MKGNFMQLILPVMVIGSLFLLAFLSLINPRQVNVTANRWLAFFFFAVACAVASPVVTDDTVAPLLEFSRFAMAPALYLSVLYFTSPGKRFKSIELLHFIPFLLFAVFALTYIIPASFKDRLEQWVMQTIHIHPGFLIFMSVKIQMIIYWTLSWMRLRQHEKNVKLFASATSPIDLWWLRYLLIGLAMMIFLWLNEVLFNISFIITITPFGYLAAVYFIAYFSLRQGEVFAFDQQTVVEIKEIIQEEKGNPSPRQSRLSDADFEAAKQKLEQLMTIDKLFLNATLGLPELSAKINASSHQLSYLINEGFGENFFQFVNRYRVEEAKRLLLSEKHRHLNMLGIAFESGFNSKTPSTLPSKSSLGSLLPNISSNRKQVTLLQTPLLLPSDSQSDKYVRMDQSEHLPSFTLLFLGILNLNPKRIYGAKILFQKSPYLCAGQHHYWCLLRTA